MGRFHKGAFFLQEQLKLDILPVYLHGNAEVMPKNDFIIHDGSLMVKVGARIPYDNQEFGLSSRERSKKVSAYFKNEFLKFRNEIESEDYFKDIIFSNYLFKEKEIQTQVKSDFEKNKSIYHTLNLQLPMKCSILHIGNDLGQLDILLISRSLDRKITSIIFDKNNYLIARNCFTAQSRNVNFTRSIHNVDLQSFDVLMITNGKAVDLLGRSEIINIDTIVVLNRNLSKIKFFNRLNKYSSSGMSEISTFINM